MLVALGLAVLSAATSYWWWPRGPVTGLQGLAGMGLGLFFGALAGFVWHSRLVSLVLPLAHVLVLEFLWRTQVGPSVATPRLDDATGLLAFLLGRGIYALIVLGPMVFAASQAGTVARGGKRSWIATLAGGFGALILVVMATGLMWPASTPPVLNASGQVIPGSVASLERVRLGGRDAWIMVRAADPHKPVLLYLSGGPGQSDLPFARVLLEPLTADYVVVGFDQRGTGKSYPALHPESLTLDRAVADVTELAAILNTRFGGRVTLLGESWGTILGVLAVQRRPDLFAAYVGSGQMVSLRETDRRIYRDLLNLAATSGDANLAAKLRALGEPPYRDMPISNAYVMGLYDKLYKPYTPPADYRKLGTNANLGPWGVLGSEYTLMDKVNVLRGLVDTFAIMYPQLQTLDFRRDAPSLKTPVFLLDGAAELPGRRDLALEWFKRLKVPAKRSFTFSNSAHSVAFEQVGRLPEIMRENVQPSALR